MGWKKRAILFDVRVINLYARSNGSENMQAMFCRHDIMKRRAYEQRIREVEHATFVPLVFSLTGGAGNSANSCLKRRVTLLAEKWGFPYSQTIGWLRAKLSFALLRSSIRCIRGARTTYATNTSNQPLDVVIQESSIRLN